MQSCASGVVTRTDGSRAEVEVRRQEACSHCSSADLCQGLGSRGTLRVSVENPAGARVGQRVEITTQRALSIQAAFFVYLVPALFFVLGVYLGAELLHWPEWASGLLGLGALAVAYLIARSFERIVGRKPEYRLTIARVIKEPHSSAAEGS
ncbi:MAG: hypothetical protein GF330_01155 [Candidatus Eisenbacteria bacterium]|nr:hypothetical protein [Candidatus Eisenbacteria bacterium]